MLKNKEDETNSDKLEFDILLELISNIIYKDQEKCICSVQIPPIDNKNAFYEEEVIPNIRLEITEDKKIKLSEIILKLKQCGFPLTGSMISIYLPDVDDFVLVGSDPIDSGIFLEKNLFDSKIIKIRAVCYIEDKSIGVRLGDKSNNLYGSDRKSSKQSLTIDKKKFKRTKERKIGYIIEKVNTWRKLYNGFTDEQGKFTKYSLDEAAKIIGISKKSLDDYLLQLRLGRRFGFDFNMNKNTKVGVLRSYVKKYKNVKVE
jgi:hypothetical protein